MKELASEEAIRIYNCVFFRRAKKDETDYLSQDRINAISYKLRSILPTEELILLRRYVNRGGNTAKTVQSRIAIKDMIAEESGMTLKELDALLMKARRTIERDNTLPLMVLYSEHELARMKSALEKQRGSINVLDMLSAINRVPYLWNYGIYAKIRLDNISGGLSETAKRIMDSANIVTVGDVLKLGDDMWEIPGITRRVGKEIIKKINALNPPYRFQPEKL